MKRLFLPLVMLCLLFVGKAQAQEELTVYDGTVTNDYVPAYVFYFDDFTRSQYVIPAADLDDMAGGEISGIKFYTTASNIPYTSLSTVDVYLMEVDYTTMTALEPKDNGTIVYQGTLDFVSAGEGGEVTINFSTPYTYDGGNLLVAIENTTDAGWKHIYFYGQSVDGASTGASNSSSLAGVAFVQRNFIPKTTFIYEPGGQTCPKPKNLAINNVSGHTADFSWTAGGEETSWFVAAVPSTYDLDDLDPSMAIPVMGTPAYTFTGLDPETEYIAAVVAVCGYEYSNPRIITFTTDVACPAPTDLASVPSSFSAQVSWAGFAGEYNLCYRPVDLSDGATVILNADDVWGDGSGYQMLLDADATAYGTIIPTSGGLTTGGDASAETYAAFEYKIPENADGSLTTTNVLIGEMGTVLVPAGVYDWCITNPTPDDRVWIASANGTIPGRYDDFEFEAGNTYEFHVSYGGQNDQVDLTVTSKKNNKNNREYEWVCVNGLTDNSYTIEGLDSDTKYEFKVQAVCEGNDGESEWTKASFTTTASCPKPTNVTVSDVTAHEATVTWTAGANEQQWIVTVNGEDHNANTTTLELTGLDPETDYTVSVVAVCSADDHSQAATATFTTEIACFAPDALDVANVTSNSADLSWEGDAQGYTVRYRELAGESIETNFDDSTMEGWTTIDADGDGYTWVLGSAAGGIYLQAGGSLAGTGHNASQDLVTSGSYSNVAGELQPDNYLVSPQVAITANSHTITFYACAQDASYPAEHFGVAVSTTNNTSATAFTTIQEWTLTAKKSVGPNEAKSRKPALRGQNRDQGNWYQFTADLSAYVGQNVYVAIRHFDCTDQFLLNIDDITIGGVEYGEWVEVTSTEAEVTLNGLANGTTYEAQVQSNCGDTDGSSEWSDAITFTTEVSCFAPTNVVVSDITAHEATITWTAGADEELWTVTVNGEEYEATTTTLSLTGLDAVTSYTVRVVAVCSADDHSQAATAIFTTEASCFAPEAITVSNVTPYTADLSWEGDAESYVVRYRELAGESVETNFDDSTMEGWTTIDADGDGYTWVLGSAAGGIYLVEGGSLAGTGHNASQDLVTSGSYSNVAGALYPDNFLVSPQVAITANSHSITFYACGQDATYAAEHFGVAVSTTNNTSASAFTTIQEWTMTSKGVAGAKPVVRGNRGQGNWYEFTADLSAYIGQEVFVAIRHFDCSDMFLLDVDDITIGSSEIGEWIEVTTSNPQVTLTELAENTQYEVQVQSICGDDDESDWSESETLRTLIDGVSEMEANINVWNRTGEIRVELTNGGNYTMTVNNILGQIVMTSNVSGEGSHIVKHTLTNGVYVVTLSNASNTFSTKIVVR